LAAAAVHESDFGNIKEAQRLAKESLALSRTRNVMAAAATAYAQSGNMRQAEALAEELRRNYPDHTLLNLAWLPTIAATIEIKQNNPSRAIETLQEAVSVELGNANTQVNMGLVLRPAYTRGQAYLLLHRGTEAATEFQKILDHPGVVVNDPLGALAHLGMARALVLQSNTAKARTEYEQFLNLWRDADPYIPILQQARAEYGNLK
jgi:tetratricopeptide (TPR) repeat protein